MCLCDCSTCVGEGTSGFDTLCHTFAPPRGQTPALTGTVTGQSVISCLYSLLLWCHFLFATCPLSSPPTASAHWTELWKQWFLDCVCQRFPYECCLTQKVDTYSLSTGQHQPLPKSLFKVWTKRGPTFPPRRPARLFHTCDCQVSFGFLNLQCSGINLTFRQCENSCGFAITECVQPLFMAH